MNNPCVFRVVSDKRRLCLNACPIKHLDGEIKGRMHKCLNVKAQVDGNRLHEDNIALHGRGWFIYFCGEILIFGGL